MTRRFMSLAAFLLGLMALGHSLYAAAEEDESPTPMAAPVVVRTHLLVLFVDGEPAGALGPYTVEACITAQRQLPEGVNTGCVPAAALEEQRREVFEGGGADERSARSRRAA